MPVSDYAPVNWVNDADPPVSAENLNHMDAQIDALTNDVIALNAGGAGIPSGVMVDYAGGTAPSGWLLCDGANLLRADYPALFAAIGTAYGAADGTHFNLPDYRGRVSVGKGTHADVDQLGDSDGIATVGNRRPRHKHTASATATASMPVYDGATPTGGNLPGSSTGGGSTPTITPPTITITSLTVGPQTGAEPTDSAAYLVANKIIKV